MAQEKSSEAQEGRGKKREAAHTFEKGRPLEGFEGSEKNEKRL
jgi:hypothetical protein